MADWYLRAASLSRVDLFEGQVRKSGGKTRIVGGDVREAYQPHEVHKVPKSALDEIRNIIAEHQYDAARWHGDDIAQTMQRDHAEMAFADRVRAFIRERCGPAGGGT